MRDGSADREEVLTDEPYSLTVGQVVDGTPSIRLLRVTVRTAQEHGFSRVRVISVIRNTAKDVFTSIRLASVVGLDSGTANIRVNG